MKPASTMLSVLDPEVLQCLESVLDPEIGLSVVDFGLVYEATRTPEAINVAFKLTTRACLLGEMIIDDAKKQLARQFQDITDIDVRLVWDPPWIPDFITSRGGLDLMGISRGNVGP